MILLSYLFPIKSDCLGCFRFCFCFNYRCSQSSHQTLPFSQALLTDFHAPEYMAVHRIPMKPVQHWPVLRSCWERPQTRSLFPWAPCWSCENPSPVQIGREDLVACRGEAEASSHLLAFNFGSGAAASQGVTNPTALAPTHSFSFLPTPDAKSGNKAGTQF